MCIKAINDQGRIATYSELSRTCPSSASVDAAMPSSVLPPIIRDANDAREVLDWS